MRLDVSETEEEVVAEETLDWMRWQLTRPIQVQEWVRRRGLVGPRGVVVRRVTFADTGTVYQSGSRRIGRGGPPDRTALVPVATVRGASD